MAGAVRIRGLAELQRDFRKISKDLTKELRDELKEAAEPVREAAEQKALTGIRNMPRSPHWAGMRVGVAGRGMVYVVPRARRRGGSGRANLKGLLQEQMDAALDEKQREVLNGVERMLDRLAGHHGF